MSKNWYDILKFWGSFWTKGRVNNIFYYYGGFSLAGALLFRLGYDSDRDLNFGRFRSLPVTIFLFRKAMECKIISFDPGVPFDIPFMWTDLLSV